jgi:chromosomal replication initiator protein
MAEWDYGAFWQESIHQLRSELGEQDFSIWLNKLEYAGGTEKNITIAVPSSFYRDEVKKRYQNAIETKLRDLSGRDLAVIFEVSPQQAEKEPSGGEVPGAAERKTDGGGQKSPLKRKKRLSIPSSGRIFLSANML